MEEQNTKTERLPAIRCTPQQQQKISFYLDQTGQTFAGAVLSQLGTAADEYIASLHNSKRPPARLSPAGWQRINVRIPRDVVAELEREKAKTGRSIAEQVRKAVNQQHGITTLEEREWDSLAGLTMQLAALGRNLNQITRRINAGQQVEVDGRLLQELKEATAEAAKTIHSFSERIIGQ